MSKIKGCVVTFEEDLPEDVAGLIVDAIKQLRFVASVSVAASYKITTWQKRRRKSRLERSFCSFTRKT